MPKQPKRVVKQLDREIAAFDRMKLELLQKYENQYVAILNEKLYDVDSDKRELVRRVYASLGMVTILIRQVLREEPEPQHLPFPERA